MGGIAGRVSPLAKRRLRRRDGCQPLRRQTHDQPAEAADPWGLGDMLPNEQTATGSRTLASHEGGLDRHIKLVCL